jgi:hypothetical protein
MHKTPLLIAFLVLTLVTMACGIQFKIPETEIKTGPTQTDEISVPVPDASPPIDLSITFGAGEVALRSEDQGVLVSGTVTYNVSDFKPVVESTGSTVAIKQGDLEIRGIPNFENDIKNEWDLEIAKNIPLNLKINAGAYSGHYNFSGLSLENLEITDGASDVNLEFTEANPSEMDTFRYNTGASTVTLEGLGYANFSTLIFRGGAGSYKLDFAGDLRQDAVISIEAGVSTVTIVVPSGVPAQVVFEGGLSNVDSFGDWSKTGDTYAQEGSGPKLTMMVKLGAGTLELRNK